MTYVLYGIVFSPARAEVGSDGAPALPPGVGGVPVRLIEDRGLGAAVSTIDPLDLTPTVTRLLSYAKVVEALHADRAILPMRYGCLLRDDSQAIEPLRAHGQEYAAVLRGLDGCVEMGVRVLLPTEPSAASPSPFLPVTEAPSGHAYLIYRAACCARDAGVTRARTAVVERLRAALGGLAERTATDAGAFGANPRLVSVCFLVKRRAVERFHRAFRLVERTEPARVLLSGPWPPYSFVTLERLRDEHTI